MSATKTAVATIIPAMRYKDAKAAVEWLCNAFDFERKLVVPGADGTVVHAELTYKNGMVMLGGEKKHEGTKCSSYDALVTHPQDIGGLETQTCYVIVDDADAHFAKAKAAGARILIDLKDEDYGGRGYTCADQEGHVWTFGTYNPW